MKTLWLEARANKTFLIAENALKELPKELALFTTVQYMDSFEPIKAQLEKAGIKVHVIDGKHTKYSGQILGCETIKSDVPAFLYVGDGLFHPQALMMQNEKPVFAYDPRSETLVIIDEKDIEKTKKKIKGAILKFLTANEIGVIITTKPGQNRRKDAEKLKQMIEAKGKTCYFFLCDNVDFSQLENFPFVEVWVNTACPRIAIDEYEKFNKPVINIDDVLELDL